MSKKKFKNIKKKSKTLLITFVIHSAIGVGRIIISLAYFNFYYFIKFNNMVFL